MCGKLHFRTCDVRVEVRAERVWNCACGSACVWATYKVRFAIALFYLFAAYALKKDVTLTFLDLTALMSRSAAASTAVPPPQPRALHRRSSFRSMLVNDKHQLDWHIKLHCLPCTYYVVVLSMLFSIHY